MKYLKLARECAEETSKMLSYNKELLDDPETLAIVLEARMIQPMGEAYDLGRKEKIPYADMSHLEFKVGKGVQ
jgi:hypothetical protein